MEKKLKTTVEVKIKRQRKRRNVCELIRAHYNSFTFFFFLASSYSYLDNNKLTSVPDLEGPKSINLL